MKAKGKSITNYELVGYLNRLHPKIEEVVNKLGYKLFNSSFLRENEINYLRLTIKHPEKNISLGDCELVSKEVERMLDKSNLIPFPYTLEVQSPGRVKEDITI